jgi:DNA-binding transcriptional MerR regulator
LKQTGILITGIKMVKLFGVGKRAEESPRLGKGFIPSDRVRELSDKGFSEPEIIDVLRKEGFSAEEIDKALTEALELKVSGQPEPQTSMPTFGQPQQVQMPQIPEPSMQYSQAPEGYRTEELIESIVNERMSDINQELTEFKIKNADLERSISDLHHQLSIMTKSRSQAEMTIITKLDSMKDSMVDVNGRMSSLEKAFKDALPALIESVRALTDLVHRFKRD